MVRYLANRTKVLLFGVELVPSGESVVAVCLCQLINTKTQDGKQTLMHFLADSIEKRFPDVMDFASEMLHVEKAARGQHFCCDNNHTTLMFAWSFLNALSLSVRRDDRKEGHLFRQKMCYFFKILCRNRWRKSTF